MNIIKRWYERRCNTADGRSNWEKWLELILLVIFYISFAFFVVAHWK